MHRRVLGGGQFSYERGAPVHVSWERSETACAVDAAAAADTDTGNASQAFMTVENGEIQLPKDFPF